MRPNGREPWSDVKPFLVGRSHKDWLHAMRTNKNGEDAFYFLGKLFGHNFKSCNGSFRIQHGKSIKSQYLPKFFEYGNIFCPADLLDDFVGFMVPTEAGGLECLGYVTQADIQAQPEDHDHHWLVPTVVFELKQMRDIQEII